MDSDSINNKDYDGFTAFLTACCYVDDLEVLKLLLDHGADVNVSNGNRTPMKYAIKYKNKPLQELLILYGAK